MAAIATPPQPAQPQKILTPHPADRTLAIASMAAPIGSGILTPLLATDATMLLSAGVLAWAGTATAGYFGRLPKQLTRTPLGGALHRQSADHLLLSMATGTAVVTAIGQGAAGVDLLTFGVFADPVSLTGVVSAAWLAAQGWCAFRLRHALTGRRRKTKNTPAAAKAAPVVSVSREESIATAIERIWREHIADPSRPGTGHRLSRIGIAADGTYWLAEILTDGRIITPGLDKHISAAYQAPRVTLTPGDHAGHARLRVDMVLQEAVEVPSLEGLEAMWQRPAVQRLLPDSTVSGTADKWGQVLTVEMPESEAVPESVDLRKLARAVGAKDMTHISWEPRQDAGGAVLRVFDRHPLRSRLEMPHDALMREGWVPVGVTATGATEYVQLYDGASARHLFVAGGTGAGKSVALDAIMRSAHRGGMGVLYGDGKGGSSDYASRLAAWRSEGGAQEAMQALRVGYALMKYRQQSGRWTPGHSGPRILLMVDEINEIEPSDPEAKFLVWRIAKNARSLGISFVLAGQSVSGEMVPGGVAARDQVVGNGGALLFRTSAVQKAVAGGSSIAGVDPDKIPQHWPDTTADPTQRESTAGLHYATAGGTAVLSKSYAPPVDTRTMTPDEFEEWLSGYLGDVDPLQSDAIQHLAREWSDWARREEIANTPVDPKAERGEAGTPTKTLTAAAAGGPVAQQPPRPAVVHTTDRQKVVDAVHRIIADGPTRGRSPFELVTPKEVLEATGLERGAVDRELRRAVDAGQLTNPERGRYGTPDPQ